MLITCGNCGNDVSDKALSCPKCKAAVKPLAISCPECSKDIKAKDLDSECPHCGYPLRHLRLKGPKEKEELPPPSPEERQRVTLSEIELPAGSSQGKPKAQEASKGWRIVKRLAFVFMIVIILVGGLYAALKFDLFGMKSSLREAAGSEETKETLGTGEQADTRLWVKHYLGMFLDSL